MIESPLCCKVEELIEMSTIVTYDAFWNPLFSKQLTSCVDNSSTGTFMRRLPDEGKLQKVVGNKEIAVPFKAKQVYT